MGKIQLTDIRLFAYHGCLSEEAVIGSNYSVDVEVTADLEKASDSDHLADTADYVHLHRIVKEEMLLRSYLLEHVSKRIADRIFAEMEIVSGVRVSVSKLNPPIGGDVAAVTVTLEQKRA